jgi:hypothetical protein
MPWADLTWDMGVHSVQPPNFLGTNKLLLVVLRLRQISRTGARVNANSIKKKKCVGRERWERGCANQDARLRDGWGSAQAAAAVAAEAAG